MASAALAAGAVALGAVAAGAQETRDPSPLVPEVTGMRLSDAESVAASSGFTVWTQWTVRPGLRGRVVGQDPEAGEAGHAGKLTLVISTGLRASGRPRAEFRTAGGAAYCQVQTTDALYEELVCWTPRTGRIVTMPGANGFGKPTTTSHRGAMQTRPRGFRTVGFGASWRYGPWNCYSDRRALTCRLAGETGREGTGLRLGRDGSYAGWGY